MKDLLICYLGIKPENLHLTKMSLIGVIVQGIFHYYSTGKMNFKLFALYLLIVFISSTLYFKVFDIKNK